MPTMEQLRRIGTGLRMCSAVLNSPPDHFKDSTKSILRSLFKSSTLCINLVKEAATLPCVACRSHWLNLHQNGVFITVNEKFFHVKRMTRRFPFFPELLARPAPKMNAFGREGLGDRFLIHIAKHQY